MTARDELLGMLEALKSAATELYALSERMKEAIAAQALAKEEIRASDAFAFALEIARLRLQSGTVQAWIEEHNAGLPRLRLNANMAMMEEELRKKAERRVVPAPSEN